MDAALEVAARDGFAEASVSRVVRRASVSRASFYTCFRGKDDCFLAVYRRAVAIMRSRLEGVVMESDRNQLPRDLLTAAFDLIAREPATARFVLAESLGASAAIRTEHEHLLDELEQRAGQFLDSAAGSCLLVPGAALVGGAVGTLALALRRRRGSSPPGPEELLRWIQAFSIPGPRPTAPSWDALGARIAPAVRVPRSDPALLPRGRNALPSAHLADARRGRILDATVRLTAAKGYRDLTVADIVKAARSTRGAFYSHFAGKQDAFLSAQALGLEESIARAAGAFFSVPMDWSDRVWAAAGALLEYLAANPEMAILGAIEANVAGEEAILRQDDARNAYSIFLEEGYRGAGSELPRVFSDATGWAVHALIRRQLVLGRATELARILPQVAYVILAPFIGPPRALAFVEARVRQGGRRGPTPARRASAPPGSRG